MRGWLLLAVVLAANAGLPLAARARGRRDWLAWWTVLLPISVFQLVPDWFLVGGLGTLSFPDIGGPRLGGDVTLALGGMWLIPLFATVALAGRSPARGAVIAFLIFLGSELLAPVVGLWEPHHATRILGVALYVLPAEAILGAGTVIAVRELSDAPPWQRVGGAAAVSVLYTGALALGWFLIDGAHPRMR